MKATVVKSKKVAVLIAIVACSISSFAQVSTMYVMKNGEVVFESPISGVDNVTFDEVTPNEALIVHKNNGSPADKILLNNIKQLSFLDGNLSAEISNGNETYVFSDIAKIFFDNITTGINNLSIQSDFEVFVTPESDVIVKSSVAIKLLTLFGIDGKMISIQQCI
jgi:hypothetical protein